jgi:hypothetical protein
VKVTSDASRIIGSSCSLVHHILYETTSIAEVVQLARYIVRDKGSPFVNKKHEGRSICKR